MKWLISLLIALLPGVSLAQNIYGTTMIYGRAGRGIVNSTGSGLDTQDIFICILPDIQNQVSMNDAAANPRTSCAATSTPPGSTECKGSFCTKSVYCDNTWHSTAQLFMRNTANDLLTLPGLIDWDSMRGVDNIPSHYLTPHDHPRCDAIISLGDIEDIDDSIVATNPTYAALSLENQGQVDVANDFLQYLVASGKPVFPLQGNHDPNLPFIDTMNSLNYTSKSYYVSRFSSNWEAYTGKFTVGNITICVVANNWITTAGITTYVTDNIGCGGSFATIILSHGKTSGIGSIQVSGSCGTNIGLGDFATIGNDPTKSPLMLLASGHDVSANCASVDSVTLAGGYPFMRMFANYQEMNRHNDGFGNSPYGPSTSDGAGGYYVVMRISPQSSKVQFTPWSPYWQGNDTEEAKLGGIYITTPTTIAYDFCARHGC